MIFVSQKLADGKCCVEADPYTYPYKVNIMSGPRLDRADDLPKCFPFRPVYCDDATIAC